MSILSSNPYVYEQILCNVVLNYLQLFVILKLTWIIPIFLLYLTSNYVDNFINVNEFHLNSLIFCSILFSLVFIILIFIMVLLFFRWIISIFSWIRGFLGGIRIKSHELTFIWFISIIIILLFSFFFVLFSILFIVFLLDLSFTLLIAFMPIFQLSFRHIYVIYPSSSSSTTFFVCSCV